MLIPIRDHNPYHRFPLITVLLLAANVVAYLGTTSGLLTGPGEVEVFRFGAVPCDVLGNCERISAQLSQIPGRPAGMLTVLTSMFMHGNLLHIGGNLLFLWIFGNNVEDRMGRVRFTIFYFLTGLAAAFAHIFLNMGSAVPIIGASGAVSGVLGAYVVMFPHARVVSLVPLGFFFFTVEVPAWLLIGLWFVMQVLGGIAGLGLTGGEEGSGVAFLAHVGGFVAGWIGVRVFASGDRRRRREGGWADW